MWFISVIIILEIKTEKHHPLVIWKMSNADLPNVGTFFI